MYKVSRVILAITGIICLLTFFLAIKANSFSTAHAQDESKNIKSQLEELRAEMDAGNLYIGFQFVVPISEGDNYWLFGDPNSERQLTIEEIGSDHFCFSQTSAQAVLIRCVPYTNVASFDYLGK